MEKLYIATRDEFLALIDEGVKRALNGLMPVNDQPERLPTGTRREVANYLQMGVSKLDQMTKTGELKSFKMGRQVRYKWDEINEYLNKKA